MVIIIAPAKTLNFDIQAQTKKFSLPDFAIESAQLVEILRKYSPSGLQKLMKINPSPYMYYIDFGKTKIVGSSPETLTRVEDGNVSTYPIAGTRPRGKNEVEDKQFERDLIHDKKELAGFVSEMKSTLEKFI